ncbi:UNKNOWN [Stylonychia lemnae]|uniref:Uncharacterized protein n=1 Tax=Stylonychia lemnae TaxID=5949 RepID=A0A078AGB1_STYLE|nr:UNKNOWN [Stylonychia lemnae]|eukprot:CDW81340.1 UNKNOWN [Stylonychia lemnae]
MSITQRYQVHFRLLTNEERIKQYNKEQLEEVVVVDDPLNINNGLINTISESNQSSSIGMNKSQLDSQEELVELLNGTHEQKKRCKEGNQNDHLMKSLNSKRRKLDDLADQKTDINSDQKANQAQVFNIQHNQRKEFPQNNLPAQKIDFSAELKINKFLDQQQLNNHVNNQNGKKEAGPSSLHVEVGSPITTEENVKQSVLQNKQEEEKQENQQQNLSQDYHQSLLNLNRSQNTPPPQVVQPTFENPDNFKLNEALFQNQEDKADTEEVQIIQQNEQQQISTSLRKRDLKNLEKMQNQQAKKQLQKKLVKHLQKLSKWIKNGKYTCNEHVTDDKLTLKVKIFTFSLVAKQQDECQLLLNEIKLIKNERKMINKEVQLFQYFVLNIFNEKEYRNQLFKIPPSQIQKYVEDPQHLFIEKQALGIRDYKHGHCSYQLAFTEEMCFDETPQRYPNIFSDKLLIYNAGGSMGEFQVCQLKRKELIIDHEEKYLLVDQMNGKNGDPDIIKKEKFKYRYYVSLPVRDNEEYIVYFPRLF